MNMKPQLAFDIREKTEHIEKLKPSTYKGIYAMHKYWSKKPPNIVAYFIDKYSEKGNLILDPFSGYGITGIEALRLQRRCALIDLNPVATFISKVLIEPLELTEVKRTFNSIKAKVKPLLDSCYTTKCPKCGEYTTATHYIHLNGSIRTVWFGCIRCGFKKMEKVPSEEDLRIYHKFTYKSIPFWYPKNIKLFDNSRINSRADMTIEDFFTARNLFALSALYQEIENVSNSNIKNFFKFVFTGALPQMSNMVFVVKNRGKFNGKTYARPREEVGSWVIGYWVPSEHFEINVWRCFENRYRKVLKGKEQALQVLNSKTITSSFPDLMTGSADVFILTTTATDLSFIPDESIDYIFTDPPHGDRIPYFELSALWAAWLKLDLDFKNEIVVSDARGRNKDIRNYTQLLYKAFQEMHRVLKPGRFMSVAFNNLDDETWLSFLDILMSSGFEVVDVFPMHYSAGSVVQDNRKGGLKSDFVFTCRKKPQPFKAFVYNSTIESESNINHYVREAVNKLKRNCINPDNLRTYQLLNEAIPVLIKQGVAFKISHLIKASNEALSKTQK